MGFWYYRFSSVHKIQFSVLQFPGDEIAAEDLAELIVKKDSLKASRVWVLNNQSKEQYGPGDLIPKNTALCICRVPYTWP